MILFGVLENEQCYLDLGLITTLLGFIGTVLISKYIRGIIMGIWEIIMLILIIIGIFYLCRSGWNT